jgi:fido (protein-threonine AMPylation protein)
VTLFGEPDAPGATPLTPEDVEGLMPTWVATRADLNAQFWHEHATFSPNELAARLHHRLVCVHPYPNGNGRQTRMMADLYLHLVHAPPFTWGGATLEAPTEARATYIASLKAATDGDISELLAFATL